MTMQLKMYFGSSLLIAIALFFSPFVKALEKTIATEQNSAGIVYQLEIDGAIGPATSDYIERNIDKAAEAGSIIVLIRMDTPGGLDVSMRQIIKKIIASPVPVVSYVAPGGARAASAGTYILYASHVAAMAPGTNLGAATPVQIGGGGAFDFGDDKDSKKDNDKEAETEISADPMTHKVVNDAAAYIRGLAKMRGRNADWAEQAVRAAASLPAEEALSKHVIDLIAINQADLLRQLDGRKINVLGQQRTLNTRGAVIEHKAPDWRSKFLSVITNPNIAYILMLVGIYGLIFEFSNPGAIVPGTVGGICLMLALFAFHVLPINYAGMALIIFGIGLMVAEAFAPNFGILGLGGVTAFVMGSIILIDTDVPGFGINPGLVGGFALSSAAFFIFALGFLLKARQKPVVSGKEELVGATGVAMQDFDSTGLIRVHSETWQAHTVKPVNKNEKVKVTGIDGLILMVSPWKIEER